MSRGLLCPSLFPFLPLFFLKIIVHFQIGYYRWPSLLLQQRAVEVMRIRLAKMIKWQELIQGVIGISNHGFSPKDLSVLDMGWKLYWSYTESLSYEIEQNKTKYTKSDIDWDLSKPENRTNPLWAILGWDDHIFTHLTNHKNGGTHLDGKY